MTIFFHLCMTHFFHALVIYDIRHDDYFANQFKSVKICNFRILFQRALQNAASLQNFCQLLVFGEFFVVVENTLLFLILHSMFSERKTALKNYDNKQ